MPVGFRDGRPTPVSSGKLQAPRGLVSEAAEKLGWEPAAHPAGLRWRTPVRFCTAAVTPACACPSPSGHSLPWWLPGVCSHGTILCHSPSSTSRCRASDALLVMKNTLPSSDPWGRQWPGQPAPPFSLWILKMVCDLIALWPGIRRKARPAQGPLHPSAHVQSCFPCPHALLFSVDSVKRGCFL